MKICTRCGISRPDEQFGRNKKMRDGLDSWCNPCRSERQRARYSANSEKYREYSREYRKTSANPRLYSARYRKDHHEDVLATTRRWREKNREKVAAYGAAIRGTLNRKARDAVNLAVKTGKLTVTPCERCGYAIGVQAHHEDYARPLDVTWLCRACHGERHREINEERRNKRKAASQ